MKQIFTLTPFLRENVGSGKVGEGQGAGLFDGALDLPLRSEIYADRAMRGLSAVARFDSAEVIGGIGVKNAPVNGARTIV